MGNWIELATDAGPVKAWEAKAQGKPKGGIIVVQEIFGANAHIRSVADAYAADGYNVLAPSFYDPVEPGVELSYEPASYTKGRELATALGFDRALQIADAAAKYLGGEHVGIVGYCWGGVVAFLSALRLGIPASSYYGGASIKFIDETPNAPVIFHYGAKDAHIPLDGVVDKFQRKFGDRVFVYPADHAFNRDSDPQAYDAESAKLAKQRTLDFFAKNL